MKRPYIPLTTKLAVLERQAFQDRKFASQEDLELAVEWYELRCHRKSAKYKISWLLELLFRGQPVELDHDPALVLRRRNKRTGGYIPAHDDPKFLIYRSRADHLHKTTGRAPGAERTVTSKGSDTWLAKKFRKLESPSFAPKSRICSRPFRSAKRRTRSPKE